MLLKHARDFFNVDYVSHIFYNTLMKKERYEILDGIRGFALINMIAYHAIWDLVYIFGFGNWTWYESKYADAWQQFICITFIFLSGFCLSFSHKKYLRGAITFACGALVTLATWIFLPEDIVVFGVLTLIGTSMLLGALFEKVNEKIPPVVGFNVSFILFLFTKRIGNGILGFFGNTLIKLPGKLYKDYFTSFLGFPSAGFHSSDYFPLMPWFFLFISGYFLYRMIKDASVMELLKKGKIRPLEFIGRHSLIIYMAHQVVIYGVLYLIFEIILK